MAMTSGSDTVKGCMWCSWEAGNASPESEVGAQRSLREANGVNGKRSQEMARKRGPADGMVGLLRSTSVDGGGGLGKGRWRWSGWWRWRYLTMGQKIA